MGCSTLAVDTRLGHLAIEKEALLINDAVRTRHKT